jgi:hypothetical protein
MRIPVTYGLAIRAVAPFAQGAAAQCLIRRCLTLEAARKMVAGVEAEPARHPCLSTAASRFDRARGS